MNLGPDLGGLKIDRTVSTRDTMVWPGAEQAYFDLGQKALELIRFSGELCDKPHYPDILDLPCGHGRVLRWLRAQYPYARLTACDLDRDAVDFCRTQFGARGVYSEPDLNAVPFGAEFDLVWCGSLLTHLPPDALRLALRRLIDWTRECGVIVFTTHGRFFATLLARGEGEFAANIEVEPLLRNFQREGLAFEPYYESADQRYGISLTSPARLNGLLQGYPNVIIRAYLEQAWGVQDVVILYKAAGHHERLLAD